MSRNRTFRYLFSEEGDVYLPDTKVLLVELPFDVDQYELGPCVDPQIDIDNPEHVISKTPVSVLDLLAEHADLLAALEQVESLAHSAGSMERKVSWNKVYKIANAAIARAKGGE